MFKKFMSINLFTRRINTGLNLSVNSIRQNKCSIRLL